MNLKPRTEIVEEQEEPAPKGVGPFDYTRNIESSDDWIMNTPEDEAGYVPYLINRAMSLGSDTLYQADEMNRAAHIPKPAQYAFLSHTIHKRKRYNKWLKREAIDASVKVIRDYYGYNQKKAEQAFKVLTKDQIEELRSRLNTGGKP